MGHTMAEGYFRTVGRHHVQERHLAIPHTTWAHGHPLGIMFHYTAGCSADQSGTYLSNGFGGAAFSVHTDGTIYEYAPVDVATWHAFGASQVYIGIEHTAYPGNGCELEDRQLEASAHLAAELIRHVGRVWGFDIPLVHKPGPAEVAGFKQHRDGTLDTWNPNGHTCHLYRWSWSRYLEAVGRALD